MKTKKEIKLFEQQVDLSGKGRSEDTIFVQARVENIELFMDQLIKSFKEIILYICNERPEIYY